MKSLGSIFIAVSLALPLFALASTPSDSSQSVKSAFRNYVSVSPTISVPTVVEVPLNQDSGAVPVFAVYNLTTGGFEPYLFKTSAAPSPSSTIEAVGAVGSTYAVSDGNYATYLEFPVREGANRAKITFTFNKPIAASSLSFALDNYVALPQTISIQSETAGGLYTVLAPVRLFQTNVAFPKTTSAVWHVAFDYVQPLRITEMRFNESSALVPSSQAVRFLAQPGQNYQVFYNADRFVPPVNKEAGDLSTNKGVVTVGVSSPIRNPSYTPADSDGDSIPDLTDNCISFANSDQKDSDSNGRGDACEDYDRDGAINGMDNCPESPNQAQIDTDDDGVGDDCDSFDNRVTERMPWLPWVGIGVAGVVLLGLFVLVLRHKKDDDIPVT